LDTSNNSSTNPRTTSQGITYLGNPDVSVAFPDFDFDKSMMNAVPNLAKTGEIIDFAIVLTNTGGTNLNDIYIWDPLIAANPNNAVCEATNTILPMNAVLSLFCSMEVIQIDDFVNTAWVRVGFNSDDNFIANTVEIDDFPYDGGTSVDNGFVFNTITITDSADQDVSVISPTLDIQLSIIDMNGTATPGPIAYTAGTTVTLQYVVINTSEDALGDVTVTSNIMGCDSTLGTIGGLMPSMPYTCTFMLTEDITPTVTASGSITTERRTW